MKSWRSAFQVIEWIVAPIEAARYQGFAPVADIKMNFCGFATRIHFGGPAGF